jgi:hypothetical protein
MSVPQIIVTLWLLGVLLLATFEHGHDHLQRTNFWLVTIRVALFAALLAWGGFWN